MGETPIRGTFDDAFGDAMLAQPLVVLEGVGDEHLQVSQASPEENQLSPEGLRAVYGEWLARRDIDPASVPHLTMDTPAYDLFRNAPSGYLAYARHCYGIPQDDQDNCRYALVDVVAGDSGATDGPQLMSVTDADFGTVIDLETIALDFQPDTDPNDPSTPERPGGALKTVDIANTLATSWEDLEAFAKTLMSGETTDPFRTDYGDIGVRAGGLAPGQKDAFIWTISPLKRSLELTVAFPKQYDSVCIVSGQMRDPINGKPGMAQIENPTEVFKIEGEKLEALKSAYQKLYSQPDFALTETQRQQRDEILDNHLVGLISNEARNNQARQDDEAYRRRQRPLVRERPLPY